MNDRDIEDTRMPKDPPTHAPCDRCGNIYDYGDLWQIKGAGQYGDDLWLCDDCYEEYREEVE